MDHLLIDTDVLLDFFYDRKPYSIYSAELMNLCATNMTQGYTTPLIISNVYYLLRKTASHDFVIDKLKQLLTIIDIIQTDKNAVIQALNSKFSDFEDALQNYSAQETGKIKFIITRNVKDYKKSELIVLSPELYLKGMN